MFGRKKQNNFRSIYKSESSYTPAEIVKEVDADTGEVYEILEPIKKEVKKSKYLPGEKMLLNINKAKNKQKSKVANEDRSSLKINKSINNSIFNLLKIF